MTRSKRSFTLALAVTALTLIVLFSTTVVVAAVSGNTTSKVLHPSWWLSSSLDIFNLPVDIPYPGIDWLRRIASPETVFVSPHTGQEYSSIYAAFVHNDPLASPCRNLHAWLNSFVISPKIAAKLYNNFFYPTLHLSLDSFHYVLAYIRNFVAANLLYYTTAAIFHYFCYIHTALTNPTYWQRRKKPTAAIMWHQIYTAQSAQFMYMALPLLDEYCQEHNYTQAFYTQSQISGGLPVILLYFILYMALVEIGIYWMHRTLHTNKFLYKYVHLPHHVYNKPEQLTPWASIAFHPIDGMLQGCPYLLVLFLVPCHFVLHLVLLFWTAIWATYIHDGMDWNVWPIMGSKYHTVHHTHYIYNYGQMLIVCDWFWGTLREPDGPTGVKVDKKKKQ